MTRFCYMTTSIIHYVHDRDFESPWLLYVNCEQLHFFHCILTTFSSSVANNSVCTHPVEYCLESVEKYSEAYM